MTFPTRSGARAASVLVALAGLAAAGCGGSGAKPTGVLLISIDSLRADHVSSYGYRSETAPDVRTTPTIDRVMGEGGARFTRAFSTTSWTLPAHMAMLTGQPNALHGVRDAPWQLHEEQPYLASAFRAAGWRTFGIWSGPNVHPYFGFDRGFERFEDCSMLETTDEEFVVSEDEDWRELNSTHDQSHAVVTGPKIVDVFTEWFDELLDEERFFAFVHMWDPHYDYHAPEAYDVFWPEGSASWVAEPGFRFRDLNDIAGQKPLARKELLRLKSLYDAEIRFTDANVERILSLLESAGRLDSTLIVVTSDHGEEFGEHGLWGHKFNLYEESVHVPLFMRLPGTIQAGSLVEDTTSIVDIAPTLLDLAGVPGGEGMWGRSLAPVFIDRTRLRERPAPMELTVRNEEMYRGARGSNYKVIKVSDGTRKRLAGSGRGNPRNFRVIEQFVDRFPQVTMGYWEFRDEVNSEGVPGLVVPTGLPVPDALKARTIDTDHPRVRTARDLWDEIDLLARQWDVQGKRKKGELSASLKAALEAAGYVDAGEGLEDEGAAEDAATDGGTAPPDGTDDEPDEED